MPVVPIVAVLANLVLVANVEPGAFVFGLLAEVIGIVIWLSVIGTTSEETTEQETPTVIKQTNPDKRDYQLLVPIANPDHTKQLMRTARDIAADKNGEILVMSVVSLPDQTPLSAGQSEAADRQEILEQMMAVTAGGRDADIPVHGIVRIGHHIDEAILHTVTQHDSDAVLMGWHGRPGRRRDVVLGTIVDTVVREADCDVLVERIGSEGVPESILLPTAGGPHAEYAASVARAIAHTTGVSITSQHVIAQDATDQERDRATAILEETAAMFDDTPYETKVVESGDVVDAILTASEHHDLTIIGATREGLLQRFVFGTIPEQVG